MKIFNLPWNNFKTNINRNARWYFCLVVVIVIGITIGLVLTFKGITEANIYGKSSSPSLFDLVTGNTKPLSLFFSYILNCLLSTIILLFLTLTIYFVPLSILYLIYQGYILGVSTASIILLSGFSGAINAIFFLVPINLLSFAILIIIETAFIDRIKIKNNYRLTLLGSFREIKKPLIFAFIILVFSAILYSIIYPLVLKTIIFVSI